MKQQIFLNVSFFITFISLTLLLALFIAPQKIYAQAISTCGPCLDSSGQVAEECEVGTQSCVSGVAGNYTYYSQACNICYGNEPTPTCDDKCELANTTFVLCEGAQDTVRCYPEGDGNCGYCQAIEECTNYQCLDSSIQSCGETFSKCGLNCGPGTWCPAGYSCTSGGCVQNPPEPPPPPPPPPSGCTCDSTTAANTCTGSIFADSCGNIMCSGTKQCPGSGSGSGLDPSCTVCGGLNQACCYGSDAYCGGKDGSRCVSGSTCIAGRCQGSGGGGSCVADGGSCLTDSSCCGGDCWVGGGSICRVGGGGSCSNFWPCEPGNPSKGCCSGFFCNTSREPFECTSTAGSCVSPPDRCGPAADGRGCCPGSYCFEGPCRERDGQGNCLDRDYNCVCQPKCPDPSTQPCGKPLSDGCGGSCGVGTQCAVGNCDVPNQKCLLPWIQTIGGDVHSNTRIDTPGGP